MKTATRTRASDCAAIAAAVGVQAVLAAGRADLPISGSHLVDLPMPSHQSATVAKSVHGPTAALEDLLDSACEVVGAAAGWLGLKGPDGRLTFPVRRGSVPEPWLRLQSGQGGAWGFEVREGPWLMNEPPAMPMPAEASPANVLTCPLTGAGVLGGYVALVNKPGGFTSLDAAVLQGFAHHIGKELARSPGTGASALSRVAQSALELIPGGVVAVGEEGSLVFVNDAWSEWTGFPKESLVGRKAPFPFWVGHRELAALSCPTGESKAANLADSLCLPYRRSDDQVIWCQTRTIAEEVEGRRLTISLLTRVADRDHYGPVAALDSGERARVGLPDLGTLVSGLPYPAVLTDAAGRILWANVACATLLQAPSGLGGQSLRDRFETASAAVLQRLFGDPALYEPGQMGRLFLRPLGSRSGLGVAMTYWLSIPLSVGTGFLFAFPEDDNLAGPDDLSGRWPRTLLYPSADWAALLIRPGEAVEGWDERWEHVTGLTRGDVAGVPGEVLLDWLFPQQRDRELVADLLHQPNRRGLQAVLEVVSQSGSRPVLCTLLPAGTPDEPKWLLLLGETELSAAGTTAVRRYLRQFARGLSHLLNHYLMAPIGLSEMALDRLVGGTATTPLQPAEAGAWFSQILESCMRASQLVEALQNLAAATPGETHVLSLAAVVREYLADRHAGSRPQDYELALELREPEAAVRVNRRMICVVLGHLLRNAEQSLLAGTEKRIEVRVFATDDGVCCEVEDAGEGLPTEDWTAVLAPFYSTKGPFAGDAAHAAQEATGLGLTVSQHLLAIHGGRLELRRNAVGTTSVMILPRAEAASKEKPQTTPILSAKSERGDD